MRSTLPALALAIAAVAALGVGGAIADGASAHDTDDALPDEYELDTVDPDDDLTDSDVADAVDTAWAHHEVRAAVDDSATLEFTVWAQDGRNDPTDASVWVSEVDDQANATVIADVDLDAGTVLDVRKPVVETTEETRVTDLRVVDADTGEDGTVAFSVENGTVLDRVNVTTDVSGEPSSDRAVTVHTTHFEGGTVLPPQFDTGLVESVLDGVA